MMVDLVSVKFSYTLGKYVLEEVSVNPRFIMYIEESSYGTEIKTFEHRRPTGLDPRAKISKVMLSNGTCYHVVGDAGMLQEKIKSTSSGRRVIRG